MGPLRSFSKRKKNRKVGQNSMRKPLLAAGLLIASLLLVACNEKYREVPITFEHAGNQLSGSVMLPKNRPGPFPVVVFVHGDGAMPYDAYGYYRPLWNRLAEQGIASFSWDKAGVGKSRGDWQNQSMDDRADEVVTALDIIRKRTDIAARKIGLIGYSQAGWVLPSVADQSSYPDFMILVSPAINWMDQGAYMTRLRLKKEGVSDPQIEQAIEEFRRTTEQLFAPFSTYEAYLQYYRDNKPAGKTEEKLMTPQRFEFVKLNWRYDARENLKEITSPTLAVFGDHDLNVDAFESIRVYREIFKNSGNEELTIKVFPEAQHSLLKEKYFRETVPGTGFIVKLELLGNDAFADGYLDFVVNWIKGKTE